MSSLNKVMLIGNLGRDPEVRTFNNGNRAVSFSLATPEAWKDKEGERREKTEWHNVVIFNDGIAKVAEQNLKKGSKVYIARQLQTREYTDKDGATRMTTEVVLRQYRGELVLLSAKEGRAGDSHGGHNNGHEGNHGGGGASLNDDIPFAPEWRV